VRTEIGEVTVDAPRDRAGSFEPQIVPKHQRRIAGFDEAVISLYAKGMTTGDIAAHLTEVYDTDISRDLVSRVTDAVITDMRIWASRPLDRGRFLPIVANPERKESQCHVGRGTRLRSTPSGATSS
jgi:putative transposase